MLRIPLPDGPVIAADTWGDPADQPVVLLHGGGQTRHAWRGTGQRLADGGYHAIAVDLRGHGDSDWDDAGRYDYDAFVDDLLGLCAQQRLHKPVLVGASLGGAVALLAVGEHRIDARALVVVDTAPRIERGGVDHLREFMTERPEGFASLDDVADAIAGYNPARRRTGSTRGLAKNVRVDADGRYHWHWDPRFMSQDREEGHWEARLARMENAVADLAVPTLLVRGGLSDLLSEEGAAAFLELCPRAEYENITGASHMVAGDRNDRFAGAVVDFLRRAAPSGT